MLITANFGTTHTGASIYYTIYNSDGTTYQARTTTGVTELVAGSGLYGVVVPNPTLIGKTVVWDKDTTSICLAETFYPDFNELIQIARFLKVWVDWIRSKL